MSSIVGAILLTIASDVEVVEAPSSSVTVRLTVYIPSSVKV